MKLQPITLFLLALVATFFTGCEVVEGIFKAGFWSAIILIVAIVGLVIFLFSRMSGKK